MTRKLPLNLWGLLTVMMLAFHTYPVCARADESPAERKNSLIELGQNIILEISAISQELEESEQTSTDHKITLYTALGLIATGITNSLLHHALLPASSMVHNTNRGYLHAAISAFEIWLIPACFTGLGISLMSEEGTYPAVSDELGYPLALALSSQTLASFTYTILSSRFHNSGAGWFHLLNQAPSTVALINSAVATAGLIAWIVRRRLEKDEHHKKLQLRLNNLHQQLQRVAIQATADA